MRHTTSRALSATVAALALGLSGCAGTDDATAQGDPAPAQAASQEAEQEPGPSDEDLCRDDVLEWGDSADDITDLGAALAYDVETSKTVFVDPFNEKTAALVAEIDDPDLKAGVNATADAIDAMWEAVDDRLNPSGWMVLQYDVTEAKLAVHTHCYTEFGGDAPAEVEPAS